MSYKLETLFARLPAEIQRRDHKEGQRVLIRDGQKGNLENPADYGPIKSLLAAMLREGQLIERDINQLYDDHFIETCADWAVPYIGKLVGAPVLESIPGLDNHRRIVAAAQRLNNSKGTLATLEYAAHAATGLPIVAVEYWKRIALTHSHRRPRLRPNTTLHISKAARLEQLGSAFDKTPHLFDSRSVETEEGQWNLPNIGLHLFRKSSVSIGAEASVDFGDPGDFALYGGHKVEETHSGSRQYRFHPLGCDAALYRAATSQNPPLGQLRDVEQTPVPITRFIFDENVSAFFGQSLEDHQLRSINILLRKGSDLHAVDPLTIKSANLAGETMSGSNEIWPHGAKQSHTLVDPETGRFILALEEIGVEEVFVSCYFGRSHDIGGKERESSEISRSDIVPTKIWSEDFTSGQSLSGSAPIHIQFEKSTSYKFDGNRTGPFANGVPEITAIAQAGAWPTLHVENPNGFVLHCADKSALHLSGLRFKGSGVHDPLVTILGDDVEIVIEDCTFVPGQGLTRHGDPLSPEKPSLKIGAGQTVRIRRSILGPIVMGEDAELILEDCIVDAGLSTHQAISPEGAVKGQTLSIIRSTVLGQVIAGRVAGPDHYHENTKQTLSGFPVRIDDPSLNEALGIRDSIIHASASEGELPMNISHIQTGCVSHSFIPPGSRVPRRFECYPEKAHLEFQYPRYGSRRYIEAAYLQLFGCNPSALLQGASNGSEMGVGNRLHMPARLRNLNTIIDEHLRFGFRAGPIFET